MDDLKRYLDALHPEQHPLLLELEQHGRKDGVTIVSREAGRLLSVVVHMMQANRILEIGTGYGYSTLWMALAQPPMGKIWTIDPDSGEPVSPIPTSAARVKTTTLRSSTKCARAARKLSAAQPRYRLHRRRSPSVSRLSRLGDPNAQAFRHRGRRRLSDR